MLMPCEQCGQVVEIATGHFPMVTTPTELIAHVRGFAESLRS